MSNKFDVAGDHSFFPSRPLLASSGTRFFTEEVHEYPLVGAFRTQVTSDSDFVDDAQKQPTFPF